MLEPWVWLAVAAAFSQNLRSALQKHLQAELSNTAAAYTRFLFGLPFLLVFWLWLNQVEEIAFPSLNTTFIFYCLTGSLAQVLFTLSLLLMFSAKSFAVGTTFSKLEVVIVAILGALLLQDTLSLIPAIAIVVCTVGVIAITRKTDTPNPIWQQLNSKDVLAGILCALFLGVSVVCFRAASLALNHPQALISAAATLLVALMVQTFFMGLWISWREPEQWMKLVKNWKWAVAVGATGALASLCWFIAFTLQNASFVRAVGTVELLFSYIFSTRVFSETISKSEKVGIVLILIGVLLMILF